jgi:hypothetical protein
MIKYKTQVGSKHENMEARELRDSLKDQLKGMYCRKCNQDTIIQFVGDGYGHLRHSIDACCSDFHEKINKKIGFNQ